jgi:predicted DsbA family dithiol-disulfide isomerase
VEALPGQLEIEWRYFSLSQVNHPEGNTWKVWEQPSKDQEWQGQRYARSLRAFWAAEAARCQGSDAFHRFHRALLRATHLHGQPLADPATLHRAAQEAGLHMPDFVQALDDEACLERLAIDHAQAENLGVFGTPTLVFPGARPVYLKLERVLTLEESLDFWGAFRTTAADRPYVLEMKRPH